MELIKYNPSHTLRGMNQQTLDQILNTKVKYWLSNLLQLSAEKEEAINNAIEGIKYHCIGITLVDVRKAFEMYANSELELSPISNHIDYILVGKIFNEYKKKKKNLKQRKIIEEPKISDQEKENLRYMGVINCFEHFKQDNYIPYGYLWVYDYFETRKLFSYTDDQKEQFLKKAERNVKKDASEVDLFTYKRVIAQLEKGNKNAVEIEYKYILIKEFFLKIIAQKKHIKEFI